MSMLNWKGVCGVLLSVACCATAADVTDSFGIVAGPRDVGDTIEGTDTETGGLTWQGGDKWEISADETAWDSSVDQIEHPASVLVDVSGLDWAGVTNVVITYKFQSKASGEMDVYVQDDTGVANGSDFLSLATEAGNWYTRRDTDTDSGNGWDEHKWRVNEWDEAMIVVDLVNDEVKYYLRGALDETDGEAFTQDSISTIGIVGRNVGGSNPEFDDLAITLNRPSPPLGTVLLIQ